MFQDIYHLAKKDISLEFRNKETLFSMGLFSFASTFIFSALFHFVVLPGDLKQAISIIFVWFIISFSVILGLTSLFSKELIDNSIYSLLSLSIKPQVIFLSKLIYLTIMLSIIELFTLILGIVFLDIDIKSNFVILLLILTMGTIDLAVAGCIVSFLTLYAKSKTLAIPILFFPLVLPSIIIVANATLNLTLYSNIQMAFNDSLILVFHAIIMLVIILLTTEELISE